MAQSDQAGSDDDDRSFVDRTTTNCVTALNNLVQLSKMGAATHEAVAHLQGLADLCSEANVIIAEIRTNLADDQTVEDPVRMAEILGRLNGISQAVQDANLRTDGQIQQFQVVTG